MGGIFRIKARNSLHNPLKMTMALSSSTTAFSTFQNRNTNYPSPKFSPIQAQTSINGLFPPTIIKRRPSVAVPAIPSSQVGSLVAGETNVSMLDKALVFDLQGNGIPITDLWKDRKAVVAFARHFGCVFCRKRADILALKKEQMDAAGVALVLIGPGSVDQAKAFHEQTKFEGEIYADPNHWSYDALEFVSGVLTTFTPKAGLKIIELYMEGYRQDWELSFQKDTVSRGGWQQGGIVVAGPGKSNISYIHKDKEAGDDPPIEDVLKACCGDK